MDSAAEDHVGDETPYRLLSKERAAVVRQIWRPGNDEGRVRGRGIRLQGWRERVPLPFLTSLFQRNEGIWNHD